MQLSEFTYLFLTLCIPFLYYIVRSTSPKKGFSILFAVLIALNVFLKLDNFSLLGLFFIAFYLFQQGYSHMHRLNLYKKNHTQALWQVLV